MLRRIEEAFDRKVALVDFLDIKGALDKENCNALLKAMKDFGLGHTLERSITCLLR